MLFRIVGPHQHAAVVGAVTYICARETTVTDAGLSARWVVLKGDVFLKHDCRTLNEAKNVCRADAGQGPRAQGEPAGQGQAVG